MCEREPFQIKHLEDEAMEDSGSEQRGTQTGGVASGGVSSTVLALLKESEEEESGGDIYQEGRVGLIETARGAKHRF